MSEQIYHTAAAGFEAARRLHRRPGPHASQRLHGHSFSTRVHAVLPDLWVSPGQDRVLALEQEVRRCVAPLDYDLLNHHLETPSDADLAVWVYRRLRVPAVKRVSLRSTRDRGVDLSANGTLCRWRKYRFESAHQLPNVPPGHKCGRMHGHGFEVRLRTDNASDQTSLNQGRGDIIDRCWAPIQDQLHNACLNDIPGLENPTSEVLAAWLWERLSRSLRGLVQISVYETESAGCHYDGKRFRIWKAMHFESAVKRRPETPSAASRLCGHSYLLRLHLAAPLDPVLGWTLDFGDVKRLFTPIYRALDHRLLDELEGMEGGDPVSVCRWISRRATGLLPQLERVDLLQTPGCGVVLCWGEQGSAF